MSQDTQKPKVILFDIGGVCVVSPMKAIIEYEKANDIPIGYINYAISASKPNGAWHRAERGEEPLDDAWFAAFKSDLERKSTWERYHQDKAKLKSKSKSHTTTTTTTNTEISPPSIPPTPTIDASSLFWTMMSAARAPDPYMAPALHKLRQSSRYHIAALSNTIKFPEGHPYNEPQKDDIRQLFELFISSAHVGMRKPNRDIYEHAMTEIRRKWPASDVHAKDVLFLDDIGENLKMGREMGWRTIKVGLGKTDVAVRELERVTGLDLLVGQPPTSSSAAATSSGVDLSSKL